MGYVVYDWPELILCGGPQLHHRLHCVNSFNLLLVLERFVLLQSLLQLQFFDAHVDELFGALET